MRDIQIVRGAIPPDKVLALRAYAQQLYAEARAGEIPEAGFYDDLWPLNLSRIPVTPGTGLLSDYLEPLYGKHGWDGANAMFLYTHRYPYAGRWHRDAPPYEEDTIVLLCVDGLDELRYILPQHSQYAESLNGRRENLVDEPPYSAANLGPGDLLLLPAGTWHRGRCSTHRITYHVRVGPKGCRMPESPPAHLPPMTLKRVIRRTVATLSYYLLRLPEDHWLCKRYTWMVPHVRQSL